MEPRACVPAGVPSGGQFAPHPHADATVDLPATREFTWFGFWDEEEQLNLMHVAPGAVEDDRPEYDRDGRQNFAASASAATAEEARELIRAEYDPE